MKIFKPKINWKNLQERYFLRWPMAEQISFAKRLAILLRAELPLVPALELMAGQSASSSGRLILKEIISEVSNGQFLSSAMSRFPKNFGQLAVSVVRLGEVSGSLADNLNYLAEELKKKQELRRKIISALIYPCVIMLATFGIAGVLAVYVLPKILPIFQSFSQQLPWSTRALIWLTAGIGNNWLALIVSAVVFIIVLTLLMRWPWAGRIFDRLVLRLPFFGNLSQCYCLANCCRTLGLLLKSEVGIVQAAEIAAATTENSSFKFSLLEMSEQLGGGKKFSDCLLKQPRLFPPLLAQMVLAGESAGNLNASLLYLAGMYEDELGDLAKNLSVVIEPALMILMGVLVGFVAVSIIMPIYGITQNLHP